MKKNELLCLGEKIIRVLDVKENKILLINCIKRGMPVWVDASALAEYSCCSEEDMQETAGFLVSNMDSLDAEQKKTMYQRYALVTPVLPFVADEKMRSQIISSVASEHGISKQTVRSYLCLYLSYLDITALAPKKRNVEKTLTKDEKNMRWGLNKFFYTTAKHSLNTAYTMMLKAKYCDGEGNLLEDYPSFYQFRYFYRKTRNLQNFYISRNGLKNYQRNNRPLTGDGVQEFAPAVGVGMLDATVCDIYLVNEAGNLVGRPILTACIDAYCGLCCGYYVSWEGGVYSLRGLMLNVIADKVEWCKQFGISILKSDWDCDMLPATLVTDMGSEYKSGNFEQITELGVKVVNLPSYRPELKGLVEKFFDLVQGEYKKFLKGKGVIEPDYQERGAHDYRKDACLTMADFEKIILRCIIYYNSGHIVENFPYTEEMIAAGVKPYASAIWVWGKSQIGTGLIPVDDDALVLTLLPRTEGKFGRSGLKINRMRYHREGYAERYLKGGMVTVAYNPEDVTAVWVLENGTYTEFALIESRFQGKRLAEVKGMQTSQKAIVKAAEQENLQAQINLAQHIEAIAQNASSHAKVDVKNIRNARRREKSKSHVDYMKIKDGESD